MLQNLYFGRVMVVFYHTRPVLK